ncbi:MAG: HEPN domain-containing protein [Planctomycetes bacterium]|nr:HEPN domain-containing protein [Planctomycetota bacterium]
MSDPARKRNIAESLARASQALGVAAAALDFGSPADAISRAYYAALHVLRALLFARGFDPRSHSGAQHLFNQHFVRAGIFPAKRNRFLASLQRQRELADYDPATVFDAEDVQQQIAEVRDFRAEVSRFLEGEGLLDSPAGDGDGT